MIILYNHILAHYFIMSKILDIRVVLDFAIIIQCYKHLQINLYEFFLAGVMTLFKLVVFHYVVSEKKPTDD